MTTRPPDPHRRSAGVRRRDFLRLAAGGTLLAGCGSGSTGTGAIITSATPVASTTPTPVASATPVASTKKYTVRFLYSLGIIGKKTIVRRQRAGKTRQAILQGAPTFRLGRINNPGDVTVEITEAGSSTSGAGICRNGTVIDAGVPILTIPGNNNNTYPSTSWPTDLTDLNDRGQLLIIQVTSYYEPRNRLWLWDNGTLSKIPLPYDTYEGFGEGSINNNGDITGQALSQGYLWKNNTLTLFDQQNSAPGDINDAGQMAGTLLDPSTGNYNVVIWQDVHNYFPLGISIGQYDPSVSIILNAGGAVLVKSYDASLSGYETSLWIPNTLNGTTGQVQSLTGAASSFFATGMNDNRDIVGSLLSTDGTNDQAGLLPASTLGTSAAPTDLNTLIDPASGWILRDAYGINNAGQITGSGMFTDASGVTQSAVFLLTPNLS